MKKRLSSKQMAFICRQLAFAVGSGLPLTASLELIATGNKEPKVKLFLHSFSQAVAKGKNLGEALFALPFQLQPLFVEFILLGEQQGNMSLVMEQAANHFEQQNRLRNMLWTALLYPLLVLGFLLLAAAVMIGFVAPSIVQTYNNFQVEIPTLTRGLLMVSQWLQQYWYLLLGILLLSILLLIWQYPRWRHYTGHIPFYGVLFRQYSFIQFAQALGLMLSNGMLLKHSLQAMLLIFQQHSLLPELTSLYQAVDTGHSFVQGLNRCSFIPPLAKQMLAVAEESNQLGKCLLKQQEYYQYELEQKLLRSVKLLEPCLIIILGIFVLMMAGSLFLPIVNSYQYLL